MAIYHVGGANFIRRFKTLEAAIAQMADDDIVELHKNQVVSTVLDKNIIIKGNGHTLSVKNGNVGLLCKEPIVLQDVTLLVESRANGLVLQKGGHLERMVTATVGPARVLYPTILAKAGKTTINHCRIMKLTAQKDAAIEAKNTQFEDYYGGSVHIETMDHASRFEGVLRADHCNFVSSYFYGTSYLTGCMLGAFNKNKGNLTMIQCKLAPKTVISKHNRATEPIDGPLQYADWETKFALEQESGSITAISYVSEIPINFVGFHILDGTLTIRNTENQDLNGYHLVHKGSLSFCDTFDKAFYEVREASIARVKSHVRTSQIVKTAVERLQELIGLTSVKNQIRSILNTVARSKSVENADFGFSWHMVFAGDPGTGKTTVAKIVAQALFEIGAIPKNKCTEVSVDRLVKGYVGQTAEHVRNVLDEALGGVLFIDEAYELTVKENQNSFNSEVLSVLIRYMEEHRNELVVIAAGYKKEMRAFLASNAGLSRRFQWIPFEDYTPTEMTDIFESMRKSYKEFYADESLSTNLPVLFEALTMAYRMHPDVNGRTTNGGNGGLVRNVFQQVIMARNNRVTEHPDSTLGITDSDLQEGFYSERKKISNLYQ